MINIKYKLTFKNIKILYKMKGKLAAYQGGLAREIIDHIR